MSTTLSQATQEHTVIEDAADAQAVLGALNDADCRTILEATHDEPLTATELSERCAIPSSTTYRKVEELAEVGLLEDRIRINTSSKHATEYRRRFDAVAVSVDGGDLVVEVTALESGTESCIGGEASDDGKFEIDAGRSYAVADD
ncbi:hypothetical protein HALLA_03700 (plasmid) [Halostagnicola larsenii XH-48]|uniref:ArsR family transcriptional regulator n=1 Tax=Halostagnicola larsenii XH-48 TaxID=797299 RepID=W0JW08_9EURY|nr:helix-turn-helix domain-containing protein [Halostagnicola larsenii]AHG01507.1 hypothetical protein HALLA_03700 [Halostagnicola larsenii XH-48]